MNARDLIDLCRQVLDEERPAHWSDQQILRALDAAHIQVWDELTEYDENFSTHSEDLSMVASQADYVLPALCKDIISVENISATQPYTLRAVTFHDRNLYKGTSSFAVSEQRVQAYTYRNDGRPVLTMLPTPNSATTNSHRVFYTKLPAPLFVGTTTGETSTAFSLTGYVGGRPQPKDADYFNGTRVEIVAGTGAGQVRPATDYSSAGAFTVTAWATTPSGSMVASIPDVPLQHHPLIAYGALRILTMKGGHGPPGVEMLYAEALERLRDNVGGVMREEIKTVRDLSEY